MDLEKKTPYSAEEDVARLRRLLRWVIWNGGVCPPGDCAEHCEDRCRDVRFAVPEAFWTKAEIDQIHTEAEKLKEFFERRESEE